MPGPGAPRGARTRAPAAARAERAEGAASGGRCWGRSAVSRPQGPGDRVGCSGPWDLRRRPARPSPPPPPPPDLGRAHAPELRCGGEHRPAQAPPLAVGVAEPVVHVELDKDDLCGARCWGRASPPPGPARPRAGVPSPRPLLTGARGHPVQAENQGDRAVGVGAGVIAPVDQHRGAPGVGRASGAVGAGQDAHRVVAVQHRAAPRHLGPELLAVCRHAGAVNTGVPAALPSRPGFPPLALRGRSLATSQPPWPRELGTERGGAREELPAPRQGPPALGPLHRLPLA